MSFTICVKSWNFCKFLPLPVFCGKCCWIWSNKILIAYSKRDFPLCEQSNVLKNFAHEWKHIMACNNCYDSSKKQFKFLFGETGRISILFRSSLFDAQ